MAEPDSQLSFEQLRELAREDGFEVVNLWLIGPEPPDRPSRW
ncbi:MAG: hypothetical protein ACI8U3_002867 [Brevundimonas sp.]|jgi:hypothetical protein